MPAEHPSQAVYECPEVFPKENGTPPAPVSLVGEPAPQVVLMHVGFAGRAGWPRKRSTLSGKVAGKGARFSERLNTVCRHQIRHGCRQSYADRRALREAEPR